VRGVITPRITVPCASYAESTAQKVNMGQGEGGVRRPLNSRLKGATWMNHQHTGIGHLPPPEIAHDEYWTGKKDLSSVFLSEHVAGILNVAKPWYGMNDTREKGGLPLFW